MTFRSYMLNPMFWLKTNKASRVFINYLSSAIKCSSRLSVVQTTVARLHILHQYVLPRKLLEFRNLCAVAGINLSVEREKDDIILTLSKGKGVITLRYGGLVMSEEDKPYGCLFDFILLKEIKRLNQLLIAKNLFSKVEIETLIMYLKLLLGTYITDNGIPILDQAENRFKLLEDCGYHIDKKTDNWTVLVGGLSIPLTKAYEKITS